MKGDNTRPTFDKEKHYSSVRMQQGRVQLDADWNEQVEIAEHRNNIGAIDTIGCCGAPMHQDGFRLVFHNKQPLLKGMDSYISAGRYYVDGILCENDQNVPFVRQPDVPQADKLPTNFPSRDEVLQEISLPEKPGTFLAYLDVWTRHVTALEDPNIREKALGGPDTATRTKTIWQVKLLRVGDENVQADCLSSWKEWDDLIAVPDGKMAAKTKVSEEKDKPCSLTAGGGYRRLENQLYRVEVHESGKLGVATFKWSRDNGSIVFGWEDQDDNKLIIKSEGRDQALYFGSGQWVELIDDSRELLSKPGIFVQLEKVEGRILTIDPETINDPADSSATQIKRSDFPLNPKVRRWDSDGLLQPTNSSEVDLEDGVQIQFTEGSYKTGDYWLIPARTAIADIEWPVDELKEPLSREPRGIRHHFCRLAILKFVGNKISVGQDCRNVFPPLTELTNLLYVSGDGQEAMPGQKLPMPLQVRVVNGQHPVEGAKVKFESEEGGGSISSEEPDSEYPDGIATSEWTLGKSGKQQVKAQLLDAAGQTIGGQVVYFNANLSVAKQVEYDPANCTNLKDITTVQGAIDELCKQRGGSSCCVPVGVGENVGHILSKLIEKWKKEEEEGGRQEERVLCLCLVPGLHVETDLPEELPPGMRLKITGLGKTTRVLLKGRWRFEKLAAIQLSDLIIVPQEVESPLVFNACRDVKIENCEIDSEYEKVQGLVTIGQADQISISGCKVTAADSNSREKRVIFFEMLFSSVDEKIPDDVIKAVSSDNLFDFEENLLAAARALASLSDDVRTSLLNKIGEDFWSAVDQKLEFNPTESALCRDLVDLLIVEGKGTVNKVAMITRRLHDLRLASAAASELTALALLDGYADTLLANNKFYGNVGLYGDSSGTPPQLKLDEIKERQSWGKLLLIFRDLLPSRSGRLHCYGNVFHRLRFSSRVMFHLKSVFDKITDILDRQELPEGTDFSMLYSRLLLTDNVFHANSSWLFGRFITFTTNDFAIEIENDFDPSMLTVFDEDAIYTGNRGPSLGEIDSIVVIENFGLRSSVKEPNMLIRVQDF